MKTISTLIDSVVKTLPPHKFAGLVALVSAMSLIAALIAQFGFGLKPCDLCLMQRIPFTVNIILGITGLVWVKTARPVIALSGISFLINSAIAAYHSGVERHWWTGLSGCSTPDMSGSIEDLMERIKNTDVTRCDEIPWEMFGLSMANYNVAMCLGLGILCLGYLFMRKNSVN